MKRNTIQRSLTFEAVKKLGHHPTAEQVYAEVSSKHPSISRGTVYRNLNQLVQDGQILSIEIAGDATHYDHTCREHYHAKCVKCGTIFDVEMDKIPNLTEYIKKKDEFMFLGCDIVFKGICEKCRHASSEGTTDKP